VSLFSEAVKTADDDTASHDPQIEEIIADKGHSTSP
jgi:hypothetical protein